MEGLWDVALSPAGDMLVGATADGRIVTWALPTDDGGGDAQLLHELTTKGSYGTSVDVVG